MVELHLHRDSDLSNLLDPVLYAHLLLYTYMNVSIYIFIYIYIIFYVFCLYICVLILCMPGYHICQKRGSDPPELELQTVVSHHVVIENRTNSESLWEHGLHSAEPLSIPPYFNDTLRIVKPRFFLTLRIFPFPLFTTTINLSTFTFYCFPYFS